MSERMQRMTPKERQEYLIQQHQVAVKKMNFFDYHFRTPEACRCSYIKGPSLAAHASLMLEC
eukprot:scaffold75319_cov16-Prasinocladus_malaysianus.AAC.1